MSQRLPIFDCLRALAILLVVGRHVPLEQRENNVLLEHWWCGGWAGVDLFFVLSGFLIGSLLFREYQKHGTINVGRFYTRRGLKIYPAFYVFLACVILHELLVKGSVWLPAIVVETLFLQNYFLDYRLCYHTWTLAIEEHFYLLLPLALWGLGAKYFRLVPALYVGLAAACLAMRMATAALSATPNFAATHLRIDSLFCGVAIGYLHCFHHEAFQRFVQRWRIALLVGGVLAFVPVFVVDAQAEWIHVYYLIPLYLGAACLVGWALSMENPGPLAKLVGRIGSYSYSLYLWHVVALDWIAIPVAKASPLLFWPLYLGCTLALGIGMALLVEYPVLKLRDRLFPSRA